MATKCPQCSKRSVMKTTRKLLRGNYNPTSRVRKYPNLQWAKVPDNSSSTGWTRIKICTDCIKTLHKTR